MFGTVLITGAGGAAVPQIIANLHLSSWRVVAVDANKYAAGLLFADAGYVVPCGDEPKYIDSITNICRNENVDAIVPLVDEELIPLSESPLVLRCIMPRRRFVKMCLDKYNLMCVLQRHGINIPETHLGNDVGWDTPLPCVVKPRVGRGSRGVKFLDDARDLQSYLLNTPLYEASDLIVQQRISGTEYTISVICDISGTIHGVVPKEIIVKQGITKLAVTRHNKVIDTICRTVQNELRADGPFNVQVMLDENGIPWIFEINPRFSTSTTLTAEAFVDEVCGLVYEKLFGGYPWPASFREGIVMVRRYVDAFMPEAEARKIWG